MKERLIVRLVETGFIGMGILGILGFFLTKNLLFFAPIVILLFFLAKGYKKIPEEKRWIVERLGEFDAVKGPGLSWICPFICKVRAQITTQEQRYSLFEKPIKIDFKNGSAEPKDVRVFVRPIGAKELEKAKIDRDKKAMREAEEKVKKSAYKMVYGSRNVKESVIDLLQNALRSYLNSLDLEEGIEKGKAGYNIFNDIEKEEKQVIEERKEKKKEKGIRKKIEDYGIEVLRITIGDFDLSPEVINARESIHKSEKAARAAEFIAYQKAIESGGMHAKIKKILCEEYEYDPQEAEEIASDYVKYFKGADKGVIRDIRFPKEVIEALVAIAAKKPAGI